MPHRLILKVTKFQLPPLKRLGTVVKNIFGGPSCPPPPISNRVNRDKGVDDIGKQMQILFRWHENVVDEKMLSVKKSSTKGRSCLL